MKKNYFYPWAHSKNAYAIDYKKLYDEGYRGIIFDIDYTLVPHNAPALERTLKLFDYIHSLGFKCVFVSNNSGRRVDWFNEKIGIGVIKSAKKPLPFKMKKAIEYLDLPNEKIISIGDQIFTDVLGSNLANVKSILVGRVDKERELHLVLKSIVEKIILYYYNRSSRGRNIER